MKLGDKAAVTRTYSAADLAGFLSLAGVTDRAPSTVPEPLIGGLFSYLLGAELPGFGTNYLKQEMRFIAPASLGEPITASVEVIRLRPDKHLVDLATRCIDAQGRTLCEGRALVFVKDART